MRYHIIDDNCGILGGEDYGSVNTYEEAAKAIEIRKVNGQNGGCRCKGSGWKIMTCEEYQAFRDKTSFGAKYLGVIPDEKHNCHDYDATYPGMDAAQAILDEKREKE